MIYRRPWHPVPMALLGLSLALHLFTVILYVRLPLRFAAFTVFPIWVWGSIGLILGIFSFIVYRARLSLLTVLIWTFTILIISDEARSLGRLGIEPLVEGPPKHHAGSKVLRVITFNCAGRTNPTDAIRGFKPDIIFLQEIPYAYHLKHLIDELFNGNGDYRYDRSKACGVIVRGTINSQIKVPKYRSQLLSAEMPNGRHLQLLNVHLQPAATNLRLFDRECWHEHSHNRNLRQTELSYALSVLKQKTSYPRIPTIIAGDFNAPANDVVYRLLEPEFTDAFDEVGTGWANTYHRSLPLLRIDHIYGSEKLVPVRSRAFKRAKSDHRMVVADFIYR
ncbi:MAG: endonuclease/exonuclease/phosphatase family protein [Akkermansiaceae bacterium]